MDICSDDVCKIIISHFTLVEIFRFSRVCTQFARISAEKVSSMQPQVQWIHNDQFLSKHGLFSGNLYWPNGTIHQFTIEYMGSSALYRTYFINIGFAKPPPAIRPAGMLPVCSKTIDVKKSLKMFSIFNITAQSDNLEDFHLVDNISWTPERYEKKYRGIKFLPDSFIIILKSICPYLFISPYLRR